MSKKRVIDNQRRIKDRSKPVPSFLSRPEKEQSRSDEASLRDASDLRRFSTVEALSQDPLVLAVYVQKLMAVYDRMLAGAVAAFENDVDVSDEVREQASMIAKISQMLEDYRMRNRARFSENITLDDSRYPTDRMNLRILMWICECQGSTLRFFMIERDPDLRTSEEFVRQFSTPDAVSIVAYHRVPVLQFSMTQLRFAMLRMLKMWTTLPMLDSQFLAYLRTLRLRCSLLQCLAYEKGSDALDYPQWRRSLPGNSHWERATTEFGNTMEMYFYYLNRQIVHEQDMFDASEPIPDSLLQDVDQFRRWMTKHEQDAMIEQLRREVYSKAILSELIPLEREVYSREFPTGYSDCRTVLKNVRSDIMDSYNRLLAADMALVMQLAPMLGLFFRFVFLIQSLVDNLDVRSFVFFSDDFPADQFGCAYPRPAFFTNLEYPTIYVPQTRRHFYLGTARHLYRCPPDFHVALSAWLRVVCGLWRDPDPHAFRNTNPYADQRFVAIRKAFKDSDDSPFPVAPAKNRRRRTAASAAVTNSKLSELLAAVSASVDQDSDVLMC